MPFSLKMRALAPVLRREQNRNTAHWAWRWAARPVTNLHLDHLASTNAPSGAVQSTGAVYFPFGGARAGNPPTDYTYTGQKIEASDGLMYYGARYYDAQLGRFISADTTPLHSATGAVVVASAGNSQSLNNLLN